LRRPGEALERHDRPFGAETIETVRGVGYRLGDERQRS
jgi:hypothetical protein